MKFIPSWIFLLINMTFVVSIKLDFLDRSCGASVSITALLLDSATNVQYDNNVNCTYTVSVSSGCFVVAQFRRFKLEYKVHGVCSDYVNVYDGSSTSGTKLNSEALCGETVADNYTSSSTSMTIHFHTDSSATSSGFDVLFTKACTAPCGSGSFSCSSGICIDSSLKCDYYNNCGDRSDESACTYNDNTNNSGDVTTLIVGLTVGLGCVFIIAGVVVFFLYRHYRWKKFLRTPITEMTQFRKKATYPITHRYYRDGINRGYYQSVASIEETNTVHSDEPKSGEDPTPMKDKSEKE
ncbi:hypothetical protein ACJMK2_009603 [Sinanodonta woodiana]|uniref:CUB domain-containing protein n=1 Tax=Sinanodonta woodiana TaxID=1069815 RepID=A0ABD3VD16_SINWO